MTPPDGAARAMMASVGVAKVTAVITRMGPCGPEVCVFDHPRAGTQLPAGTLLPGEEPGAGALREGFEETGLGELRAGSLTAIVPASAGGYAVTATPVVFNGRPLSTGHLVRIVDRASETVFVEIDGDTGVVSRAALSFNAKRYLVHLMCDSFTPDEWYVTTPDGGGNCWRCHWIPLDADGVLVQRHQEWLTVARDVLGRSEHRRVGQRQPSFSTPLSDLTIEMFWAPPWSASRALVSWLEPDACVDDADVNRVEAVAMTHDGEVVVISEQTSERGLWSLPGGRREPGEGLRDTLLREVAEEACGRVASFEQIGYLRFQHLDGQRAGSVTTDAVFCARVEPDAFVPRFETRARRTLSLAAAQGLPLWANPITLRVLSRAAAAERRAWA
jgi:8-oxo-dGTP pyrophosphatase MutT (NUDIX family)